MTIATFADALAPRLRGLASVLIVLLASPASGALAFDFLRGTTGPSYSQWNGVYFGGSLNRSFTDANFGSGTSDLVAFILRDTTLENVGHVSSWNTLAPGSGHFQGFGGFLGYNFQIAPDLVVGFEGNYTKLRGDSISSTDTEARSFDEGNGFRGNASVTSSITATLRDYASARARAGYVMGQFLPYGFIGVAAARGTVDRSASVFATETQIAPPNTVLSLNPNPTIRTDHSNFTTWGPTLGFGLEVTVLPNVFLRAEYEFAAFHEVAGTRLRMQTGRVGVGLKF
ncbi:MAG: outer membrane protein [Pseudolabrys sp.]